MDDQKSKTNQQLTSTMGNVLSLNNKEDKNDACDSTPTSSTDANTTSSTLQLSCDDPISSTSSDLMDQSIDQKSTLPETSSLEKDMLDINISDVSTEKITENVDDIVQDLENLLGKQPTSSYIRSSTTKSSTANSSTKIRDILLEEIDDLDLFKDMFTQQKTDSAEKKSPNKVGVDKSEKVEVSETIVKKIELESNQLYEKQLIKSDIIKIEEPNKTNEEHEIKEAPSTSIENIPIKETIEDQPIEINETKILIEEAEKKNDNFDKSAIIENKIEEKCEIEREGDNFQAAQDAPKVENDEILEKLNLKIIDSPKIELETQKVEASNATEKEICEEKSAKVKEIPVLTEIDPDLVIGELVQQDFCTSTAPQIENMEVSSEIETLAPEKSEIEPQTESKTLNKENIDLIGDQKSEIDQVSSFSESNENKKLSKHEPNESSEKNLVLNDEKVEESIEIENIPISTKSQAENIEDYLAKNVIDSSKTDENSIDEDIEAPMEEKNIKTNEIVAQKNIEVSPMDETNEIKRFESSNVEEIKENQEINIGIEDETDQNQDQIQEKIVEDVIEENEVADGEEMSEKQEMKIRIEDQDQEMSEKQEMKIRIEDQDQEMSEKQKIKIRNEDQNEEMTIRVEDQDDQNQEMTEKQEMKIRIEDQDDQNREMKIRIEDQDDQNREMKIRIEDQDDQNREMKIRIEDQDDQNQELTENQEMKIRIEDQVDQNEEKSENQEVRIRIEDQDDQNRQMKIRIEDQDDQNQELTENQEMKIRIEDQDDRDEKMFQISPINEEKIEETQPELLPNEEEINKNDQINSKIENLDEIRQEEIVDSVIEKNEAANGEEMIENQELKISTEDEVDQNQVRNEQMDEIVRKSETKTEINEENHQIVSKNEDEANLVQIGQEEISSSIEETEETNENQQMKIKFEDKTNQDRDEVEKIEEIVPIIEDITELNEEKIEEIQIDPIETEPIQTDPVLSSIQNIEETGSSINENLIESSVKIDQVSASDPTETQRNMETLMAVASLQGENIESDYNSSRNEEIKMFDQPGEELTGENEESAEKSIYSDELSENLIPNQEDVIEEIKEDDVLIKAAEECRQRELIFAASEECKELPESEESKELKQPLVIDVDNLNLEKKEKLYSPKITIKPIKQPSQNDEEFVSTSSANTNNTESESNRGFLKMTITKQSDTMHSILKIYNPDDENLEDSKKNNKELIENQEQVLPKLIIKSVIPSGDQQHSPKMSTRSSKQVYSPNQRSSSPRITIKPIVKPDCKDSINPLKITIKPVLKSGEESHRQKHSPKLTIKPIVKPPDEDIGKEKGHSPRVTIKPIIKSPERQEQTHSPRITIKPIVKPSSEGCETTTPRVTIKPLVKPSEKSGDSDSSSPKIIIKPVKPPEGDVQLIDFEDEIKERIVLKINKGNLPISKESRKREYVDEKSEKLAKIKLKISKEDGHPHIVHAHKRQVEHAEHEKSTSKKMKSDTENPGYSKLKDMLVCHENKDHLVGDGSTSSDDVKIVDSGEKTSPILISEDSTQDSAIIEDKKDPLADIPIFEINVDQFKAAVPIPETPPAPPAPRKRGRPRKVPLVVREEFKDQKEEEPKPIPESTRPKRSCRGQSVRTTLGIKPRKPRGGGRGRGGKRGMGTRAVSEKIVKETKLTAAKLKLMKETFLIETEKPAAVPQVQKDFDDGFLKSPQTLLAPPSETTISSADRADIVMFEEETRMSAETSSRAQTPAKQVIANTSVVEIEESQSSVQSTATTESVKAKRGSRMEVHLEPEGAVISADQLAEYYWSGGGPYMLQEQVAQFLGIKSFKRKYPNIARRFVDMQERDFIRESGLASEAMCDLGLTAVNSADILDIMYSDFQDKYEEYCKHQRDRQAKDLTNKQKALSLAASQEKTKLDITQQAVQSAASWNVNFNKTRREQRKAFMDLQTLTVHFPKGKIKQINKPKLGHYPVALVPGQFTDYYQEFTPTEINNLPLNTMCYEPINVVLAEEMDCESQSDGSVSDSDSSTSYSDSSFSGSSYEENCTLCKPSSTKKIPAV